MAAILAILGLTRGLTAFVGGMGVCMGGVGTGAGDRMVGLCDSSGTGTEACAGGGGGGGEASFPLFNIQIPNR